VKNLRFVCFGVQANVRLSKLFGKRRLFGFKNNKIAFAGGNFQQFWWYQKKCKRDIRLFLGALTVVNFS
jgi:hypothetical protein